MTVRRASREEAEKLKAEPVMCAPRWAELPVMNTLRLIQPRFEPEPEFLITPGEEDFLCVYVRVPEVWDEMSEDSRREFASRISVIIGASLLTVR